MENTSKRIWLSSQLKNKRRRGSHTSDQGWSQQRATLKYGPRPLHSTRRHGHFLKSTCDIEPSDMRKNVRDTTWGISSIRPATWEHLRGDMGHGHSSDKGHWRFLNSTCDMGTPPPPPPSRAPSQSVPLTYQRTRHVVLSPTLLLSTWLLVSVNLSPAVPTGRGPVTSGSGVTGQGSVLVCPHSLYRPNQGWQGARHGRQLTGATGKSTWASHVKRHASRENRW